MKVYVSNVTIWKNTLNNSCLQNWTIQISVTQQLLPEVLQTQSYLDFTLSAMNEIAITVNHLDASVRSAQ